MGSGSLAFMVEFPRKADGRRVFSVAFKREAVARITSGEKTLAELSRELGISPSVLRNWLRLVERGGTTAMAAAGDVASLAQNVDVAPSLLELAGLPRPKSMQGISLVKALAGDSPRKRLFFSTSVSGHLTPEARRALRCPRWATTPRRISILRRPRSSPESSPGSHATASLARPFAPPGTRT